MGAEFFTYAVLFIIGAVLVTLIYYLISRLKVRNVSQYAWLGLCSSIFIYSTLQLRTHPEEAVHLLEYGLLAFLIFRALSFKIHDWTVYITSAFLVFIIGTADEFIQWLTPSRYWSYKDVGINTLAGAFFMLAIAKGINPTVINSKVRKYSAALLMKAALAALFVLGLCLSNTPEAVHDYTGKISGLSWLRHEETMTDYGFRHSDPEIGTFYSHFSIEELKRKDRNNSLTADDVLTLNTVSTERAHALIQKPPGPYGSMFHFEFNMHILKRDLNYNKLSSDATTDETIETAMNALRENTILENFFSTTLERTAQTWSETKRSKAELYASSWKGTDTGKAGKMITVVRLKTVWVLIIMNFVIISAAGLFWEKKLKMEEISP